MSGAFDICIVGQAGRLSYEAVLFAASLRRAAPDFSGKLIVGEPQPGVLWPNDPRLGTSTREALEKLGAEILPFESKHFGKSYPNGNKVEMLAAMPAKRPFVFFDTDTIITGPIDKVPFDFDRPSASMARENTWPIEPLYGPDRRAIWQAVYTLADADLEASLDHAHQKASWQHHLYFNAGWFHYRCPNVFAKRMIDLMVRLRSKTPAELACQSLDPWLDQIALPAVITALGGGRPGPELSGLDGDISNHWRTLPLLYARASDATIAFIEEIAAPNKIKKVLKEYEPFKRIIYQGRGEKIRALFDRNDLPKNEKVIRNKIKRNNLWMR